MHRASSVPAHGGRTYAAVAAGSNSTIIAVTKSGSHCPFFDAADGLVIPDALQPGYMLDSWADSVMVEWFDAAGSLF